MTSSDGAESDHPAHLTPATAAARLVGLNLALGFALWVGECTDYQLAGTIPSLLFRPGVALVALLSLWSVRRWARFPRRLVRLSCLPSLVGGGTFLLSVLLFLVPPFTLGGLYDVAHSALLCSGRC
jgi:hypothetical protein